MSVRRGFTLAEVVVAIGLMLALAGSIAAFAWNLALRRTALLEAAGEVDAGARVFEAIERAMLTAVADAGGRAGVRGTDDALEVSFRGVQPALEGDAGAALGDAQRLSLAHDAARAVLTLSFTSGAGLAQRVEFRRVSRVRVRYLVGERWSAEFESGAVAGLPRAVEVALWFGVPLPGAEAQRNGPGGDLGEAGTGAGGADFWLGDPVSAESSGAAWSADARASEPDRVRVIAIPDAAAGGGGAGGGL